MRYAAERCVHPRGRSCSPRMAERGLRFHTSVRSSSLPATGDGDTEKVRDRRRVPERSGPDRLCLGAELKQELKLSEQS